MCLYIDIDIFEDKLPGMLQIGETVIAERGYTLWKCITPTTVHLVNQKLLQRVCSRHKTLNENLKNFNVVRHIFRQPLYKNAACYYAVGQVTKLMWK